LSQGYILDTDTLSFYLKNHENVVRKIKQIIEKESSLGITIITHYEILSGLKFKHSEKFLKSYISFTQEINIYPLTEKSIEISSDIYATLRKKGNPLDDMDLLIAGIAIEGKQVLVTGNSSHFNRIKVLKIEDWS